MRLVKFAYYPISLVVFCSLLILDGCTGESIFIHTVRFEKEFNVGKDLNQIYFTNETNGVVIGDDGAFLYTTNAGESWQQVPDAPEDVDYNSISFPTRTTGYVSGEGALLRTTDGGASWELIGEPNYISTSFPAENVGYGVSSNYTFKTVDGGESWTSLGSHSSSGLGTIKRVYFYTIGSGVLVEDGWSYVSKTTSGGSSWSYATEDPKVAFTHVQRFVNGISYWAAGNNTYYSGMFYTDDGTPVNYYEASSDEFTGSRSMWSMHSWDGLEFIAVGGSVCGISHDGGLSWVQVYDENGRSFSADDAAVMKPGRYAAIAEQHIYLLTQDCVICE